MEHEKSARGNRASQGNGRELKDHWNIMSLRGGSAQFYSSTNKNPSTLSPPPPKKKPSNT